MKKKISTKNILRIIPSKETFQVFSHSKISNGKKLAYKIGELQKTKTSGLQIFFRGFSRVLRTIDPGFPRFKFTDGAILKPFT